ncbi:MAG: hypothetical protein WKG03_21695, partial [Telluria sp.]
MIMNPYTIIAPMKTKTSSRASRIMRSVLALTLLAGSASAHAQLRLPSINMGLPQTGLPLGGELLRDSGALGGRLRELPDLRDLRLVQVKSLLREHRKVLEAD